MVFIVGINIHHYIIVPIILQLFGVVVVLKVLGFYNLTFFNDSYFVSVNLFLVDSIFHVRFQTLVNATVLSPWSILRTIVLLILQITNIVVINVTHIHVVNHIPLFIIVFKNLRFIFILRITTVFLFMNLLFLVILVLRSMLQSEVWRLEVILNALRLQLLFLGLLWVICLLLRITINSSMFEKIHWEA